MQRQCLGMHVLTHAAHLNGVRREETTAVLEVRSRKANRIVTFVDNQHSDDLLVAVDYEISSELVHILTTANEVVLAHASQVTEP